MAMAEGLSLRYTVYIILNVTECLSLREWLLHMLYEEAEVEVDKLHHHEHLRRVDDHLRRRRRGKEGQSRRAMRQMQTKTEARVKPRTLRSSQAQGSKRQL